MPSQRLAPLCRGLASGSAGFGWAEDELPTTLGEFSSFEVPDELVAQRPAQPRDSARMIVLHRATGVIEHRIVSELPAILAAQPDYFVVCVNNSSVVDCKLEGMWSSDGQPQVLYLLERSGAVSGAASLRWLVSGEGISAERNGDTLQLHGSELAGVLVADAMQAAAAADGVMDFSFPAGDATSSCSFSKFQQVSAAVDALSTAERIGQELARVARVPLPPYITATDGEGSYQTMFATESESGGSVAAPTAGLHFTDRLVSNAKAAGVGFEEVTLHVGYGTFGHVHDDDLSKHHMHAERFEVSAATAQRLTEHHAAGGKILSVGTTATRTLETCAARAADGEFLAAGVGETDIFIRPGFEYKAVDAVLTNLHMPGLTPLMLISAFASHELVMRAYAEAIERRYRFYSFGDCMLVL